MSIKIETNGKKINKFGNNRNLKAYRKGEYDNNN